MCAVCVCVLSICVSAIAVSALRCAQLALCSAHHVQPLNDLTKPSLPPQKGAVNVAVAVDVAVGVDVATQRGWLQLVRFSLT